MLWITNCLKALHQWAAASATAWLLHHHSCTAPNAAQNSIHNWTGRAVQQIISWTWRKNVYEISQCEKQSAAKILVCKLCRQPNVVIVEVWIQWERLNDVQRNLCLNITLCRQNTPNTGWAKKPDHFWKCVTPVSSSYRREWDTPGLCTVFLCLTLAPALSEAPNPSSDPWPSL